jgi:hypothetical protein
MQITFDTDKFSGRYGDKSLTNVLCYLNRHGCFEDSHYPEIERITCRTPSSALRYVRLFARKGISPANEAVFLKNPSLGIRYLNFLKKKEFSDPVVQKKFRRKFKSNAQVAYEWAERFNERLSEEEEEVFRKDVAFARDYAFHVIKGKFPEKIHSMLVLASFQELDPWRKRKLSEYIKFTEGK